MMTSRTRRLTANLLAAALLFSGPALASDTTVSVEPTIEKEAGPAEDPNKTGFGINETAIMPEEGSFSWTGINFGLHHFEYQVHENVTLTANATLPLFIVGGTAGVRVGGEVAEDLHIAANVDFGGVTMFGFDDLDDMGGAIVFGGGPSLTYGSDDLYFNAKGRFYGFASPGNDGMAWVAMPSIGGGVRVTDFMRLYADVGPMFVGSDEGIADEVAGELWFAQYGAHFHGEHLYGDVSFVVPIFDGAEELLRYVPLGFPSLSLGASF